MKAGRTERERLRAFLRRDMLAAWDAYRQDGRHVTGEEAEVWFVRLEAGEDADPPEPHAERRTCQG